MQGDKVGATAARSKIVPIDPNDAYTHCSLAGVLGSQDAFPGAVTAFKRAIAIDPNYVQALAGLSCTLKEQGNIADAIAAAQAMLDIDPHSHWADVLRDFAKHTPHTEAVSSKS